MDCYVDLFKGYRKDDLNQPGLDYYNKLIDALLRTGLLTKISITSKEGMRFWSIWKIRYVPWSMIHSDIHVIEFFFMTSKNPFVFILNPNKQ